MRQQDITEGNVIAVWLGDFEDDISLDDYIQSRFESDFGFSLNERAMPEVSEPDGSVHSVRDLLDGFSWSEDWLEDAVRLCEAAGWQSAKAAVVFLHLRYRPELHVGAPGPLHFVASVPWHHAA